jgi:hypothetical protein
VAQWCNSPADVAGEVGEQGLGGFRGGSIEEEIDVEADPIGGLQVPQLACSL